MNISLFNDRINAFINKYMPWINEQELNVYKRRLTELIEQDLPICERNVWDEISNGEEMVQPQIQPLFNCQYKMKRGKKIGETCNRIINKSMREYTCNDHFDHEINVGLDSKRYFDQLKKQFIIENPDRWNNLVNEEMQSCWRRTITGIKDELTNRLTEQLDVLDNEFEEIRLSIQSKWNLVQTLPISNQQLCIICNQTINDSEPCLNINTNLSKDETVWLHKKHIHLFVRPDDHEILKEIDKKSVPLRQVINGDDTGDDSDDSIDLDNLIDLID